MEISEIQHLAALARIRLTDEEAGAFAAECDSILAYVAQVKEISTGGSAAPSAGAHKNVLREDVETTEPEAYAEALLAAAPDRDGRYLRVKKILGETP
ncbi:Asp-tRNA(Asn)/Glu-tRNA(Gln) amidotransferase subunit GatC [Candidatus Kaiserbacteria bacterium]|nr:Asp-tRNA(Asn)/Glu-tRNA(Gln) amidotransferase subunit GatC [Candidatus Kaiserbacteria bacterium]